MKIKKENGKIYVSVDYSEAFIKGAKQIQGKWEKPYWVFSEDDEELLNKLLTKHYGEAFDGEIVTLLVDLKKCTAVKNDEKSLYLETKCIATRYRRDDPVYLPKNVVVVEGEFDDRGGSVKNPVVTWDDTTSLILRIKQFPKGLYDRIEDKTGIELVKTDINFAALKKERERLEKQIAEIDSILAGNRTLLARAD